MALIISSEPEAQRLFSLFVMIPTIYDISKILKIVFLVAIPSIPEPDLYLPGLSVGENHTFTQ